MMNHEAIYALYPEVVTVDDGAGAFDADGNSVEIDMEAVAIKAAELEADKQAKAQTVVAARQSALDKLMALGLTEEEALALGVK